MMFCLDGIHFIIRFLDALVKCLFLVWYAYHHSKAGTDRIVFIGVLVVVI